MSCRHVMSLFLQISARRQDQDHPPPSSHHILSAAKGRTETTLLRLRNGQVDALTPHLSLGLGTSVQP